MKVKICGLRRVEDAQRALHLGASHLGVVLAADSPRRARLSEARAIVAAARGRAAPVLVFRGEDDDVVVAASRALGVRRVQVHGAGRARCARLARAGVEPLPVVQVAQDAAAIPTLARAAGETRPVLLDGGGGGQGRRFRWSLLAGQDLTGVFVAGGLRPHNLSELLDYRPWGVDVSSGVESAPGVKDAKLLSAFFNVLARAEVSL